MKLTKGMAGLLTTVLIGAAWAAAPAANSLLAIGSSAPMADIRMKNIDGSMLALNDLKGAKGTLVIFTCNHCPYAVAWEDRYAAIGNQAIKDGFGVVAINANDPSRNPIDGLEGMAARAKERGFKFPYVVDDPGQVAKAFGATRTPEVFLFDAAGKLAYHGAIDDSAEDAAAVQTHYLKDALTAVGSGKEVAIKNTKAIGCSIKFRS
jgi:peroxiredoxin